MKAIAAMALNRVIGSGGRIPWHLPEDFRWFKRCTTGHAVLMGRKTFESLGKPLPNRLNLVATHQALGALDHISNVAAVPDLQAFRPAAYTPRQVWVIGGAEIYAQLLGRCTDLYLSVIAREVEGDTFFPPFEEGFQFVESVFETPEFTVKHYRRTGT